MNRRADVVVGSVLLALCALAFFATTTFREVPDALSQNVPPTFFPRLVLLVIAALSLALVVLGRKRAEAPREKARSQVITTGAILAAAVALVPVLGMLPTVPIIAVALPLYWGERRAIPIVGLAVGLPLAIYLLFVVALGMRFPRGVFW